MSLARRNLLRDRTRFVLSTAGVGLAIMLVLLLGGFESGFYRQISAYLDRTPGSLVVTQAGVTDFLGVTSVLPAGATAAIERTDGVERAIPILSQFIILDLHGRRQPVYLVGYDPARGGGPWQLAEGREPAADDEAVLDRVLAARHDLTVGDTFELMGGRIKIVGLAEGTSSWMTSFLFLRSTGAATLFRAPGVTSFVFVTPSGELDRDALAGRLRAIPGIEVTAKETLVANDRRLLARILAAPLELMTGIAFVVGTLVVGLILYTATIERRREYGVLKAIGARNRTLYRVTTTQALLIASAGSLAGVALAVGAGRLIMALRPEFLVTLEPPAAATALVAGLAMALLGALVPARLLGRLAPAEVFRR